MSGALTSIFSDAFVKFMLRSTVYHFVNLKITVFLCIVYSQLSMQKLEPTLLLHVNCMQNIVNILESPQYLINFMNVSIILPSKKSSKFIPSTQH